MTSSRKNVHGCLMLIPFVFFSAFSQPKISFLQKKDAEGVVLSISADVQNVKIRKAGFVQGNYICSSFRKKNLHERLEEYIRGVRDFSDEDRKTVTDYVQIIDSILKVEFPALGQVPWKFVLVSDSLETALPDTRTGHIILSRKFVKELKNWKDKSSSTVFTGLELLLNDKIHILQNLNPAPFEKFYKHVWGFRKVTSTATHSVLQECLPLNGSRPQWVMKINSKENIHILPALILKDSSSSTLQSVGIIMDSTPKGFFPRMSKDGKFEYRDLNLISQYREKFPHSEFNYHPHELSADLLAKYLVRKYVSSRYGTAAAKKEDYSRIDKLIGHFGK